MTGLIDLNRTAVLRVCMRVHVFLLVANERNYPRLNPNHWDKGSKLKCTRLPYVHTSRGLLLQFFENKKTKELKTFDLIR